MIRRKYVVNSSRNSNSQVQYNPQIMILFDYVLKLRSIIIKKSCINQYSLIKCDFSNLHFKILHFVWINIIVNLALNSLERFDRIFHIFGSMLGRWNKP
jgi:hypothetical protein